MNRKRNKKKIDIKGFLIAVETALLVTMMVLIVVLLIPEKESFEIERKWLIDVNDIPYDLSDAEVYDIRQSYISFNPEIRLRNINDGWRYMLTIKTDDLEFRGLKRTENEYFLDKEQYESLLAKKEGLTIHKTRYSLRDYGRTVEIDIFHDELEGLAYMEMEFSSVEEANKFNEPDWIIEDVTTDLSYKNGHLVRYGIPESFSLIKERRNKKDD